MWRWSYTPEHFAWLKAVFSTYVEVIPRSVQKLSLNRRVLHVCGGDPIPNDSTIIMIRCSPRMWRWSYSGRMVNLWFVRVLHVCGGDPKPTGGGYDSTQCSPRMWRWSWVYFFPKLIKKVFSTYVEVIPKDWIYLGITVGVLHVCGGDPAKSYYLQIFKECSPRMWRWS